MNAFDGIAPGGVAGQRMTLRSYAFLGVILLVAGAFLAPGVPFIIDGGIYYDMARAMAEDGSLAIGGNGGVEGAPAMTKLLTYARGDLVYPQYPSGYALLAAPFFKLFGIHGLMAMNALGFAASLWLCFAIARRLFDAEVARLATAIFALATFAPTYMFGVWPHMVALAFWLGAFHAAIIAAEARAPRRAFFLTAISGLLIGAGLNIRIDVFLAFLIMFFWLRLFARPADRLTPAWLMAGLVPGVLLAAALNQMKFGAFAPFSYGDGEGAGEVGRYIVILAVAGAGFVAAWVVNLPVLASHALARRHRLVSGLVVAAVAILCLAVAPLREIIWSMLRGLYVLVINLQAHRAYHQDGVGPNEFGQVLFWGYPKKALIQSIPWAPLALIPVVQAFRGRNVAPVGLCGLAIAAPLCFYALNEWHGGGSYNMRYFLPALPFLAMLAAVGMRTLLAGAGLSRQALLAAVVAAALLYVGLQEIGQASARLYAPAALYPQWLIAGVLSVALLAATRTGSAVARKTGIALALFALAYAGAVNLYEEFGHERTRAEQKAMAEAISAPLPPGSLVITPLQLSLLPAERRGVFVMAADSRTAGRAAAAAGAFAGAGRCVYFHNSLAVKIVAPYLGLKIDSAPLWAPSARFHDDPRLAFFVPAAAPDHCRF